MTEEITNLIIALIPSIVGVLGIIGSVLTCVSKVKALTNDSSKQVAELRQRLKESISSGADLQIRYDEIKLRLDSLHEDVKEATAAKLAQLQETATARSEMAAQSQEIKELTAELKKVKAQLRALLKEN